MSSHKGGGSAVSYPVKRNLDGVYFRVERDGRWEDLCFTDLTEDEQEGIMYGKSDMWLREMVVVMADSLREVGDRLDLVRRWKGMGE